MNRGNQMNPSHSAYYSSRGIAAPAHLGGGGGMAPTAVAHRADQLNPSHAAYYSSRGLEAPAHLAGGRSGGMTAADVAHRADQLNPSHEAYYHSRGIADPGPPRLVHHGTSPEAAEAIRREGFRPSERGMLGPAVYVSADRSKAEAFSTGGMVRAYLAPGRVATVTTPGAGWMREGYDTAHVPAGTAARREEDAVRDPRRLGVLPD